MKKYHKYCDNDNKDHNSIIINDTEEIVKLIESCEDGNIRIWDFNEGHLLKSNHVLDHKTNLSTFQRIIQCHTF